MESERLLQGIKVADFTWVLVGPLTTKFLSDCGAEVIKIEGKTRPDVCRTQGAFKAGEVGLDRSHRFLWHNTGKLSLAVNLAHPQGVELAKRVVAWADVVVENFAGGSARRMGLGYEDLRKVKPEIIMLSASMQGQTGPHASHPGYGMQLTALSGFDYITGWPELAPVELGFYTDFIAPHIGLVAILAALDYRHRTGKGQYIDLSQYECSLHFMAPLLLDYTVNGRTASRRGNQCDYAAPHGVYRCLGDDRWCTIAVFTDEEWRAFGGAIGDPAWSYDPRFANLVARKQNESELDSLIEEWTVNRTAEQVMTLLQSAGVAAGVVQSVVDVLEGDPQLRHRDFFRWLEHPEVEQYRAMRPHYLLSGSSYDITRAPLIGEHNEHVCKDILGMSDEEIAELVVQGVIE